MPTRKKITFSELKVGIVVLVAIALLIFMILTASGEIGFIREEFLVRARVAEVDGLIPGNEVRLAGVRVGNVVEVKFGEIPTRPEDPNTVEIVMRVNPEIARERIRSDSVVTLGSIGLLGDKVVEISPGTKNGKPIQSGDYLQSAPGTNIRKIISGVDPLIADLTDTAEQIRQMVLRINQGQGTVGKLIRDPKVYEDLDATIIEARDLVRRIREGEGTVGRLINDPTLYDDLKRAVTRLERVTREIQEGQGTISRLLREPDVYDSLNRTMKRVEEIAERVDTIATRIEKGEGTVGRLINDPALHEDARVMVANMKEISGKIETGEGTLGALVHDRQLYDNLNSLSSELVRLLYDFRQNPGKFLRFKISIF
ncbi:MAG TPA: MlaD family protein [Blastocatellia bacterium]|nr:MlaD family protein [Blastocatellia bacterium]